LRANDCLLEGSGIVRRGGREIQRQREEGDDGDEER